MPRRKKTKKSSSPKSKKPQIESLSGYSLGQHVYCLRYPDDVLCCGNIVSLHKTPADEFITFIDEITGQYRISLLEKIIDDPTKKQIMSTQAKMRSYLRQAKRIEEQRKLKKNKRRR